MGEGGGVGKGSGSPLKNKSKEFLGHKVPDPLENHKATNAAFNVSPSSARQGTHLNGVSLADR